MTATTIQFSFSRTEKEIDHWVNGFWYSSLVFSVASVVNSLFSIIWRQAVYRSPGPRLPWWVHVWIKRTPLVFLIMSVATFSAGLCIFTYASHQPKLICILITALTAFSSFGLFAVSSWFVFERFVFARYNGRLWPSDVITKLNRKTWRVLWFGWIERLNRLGDLRRSVTRCFSCITNNRRSSRAFERDLEVQSMQELNKPTTLDPVGGIAVTFDPQGSSPANRHPLTRTQEQQTRRASNRSSPAWGTSMDPEEPAAPRNVRLKNAVHSVMMLRATGSAATGDIFVPSQKPEITTVVKAGDRRAATATRARRDTLARAPTAGRLARIATTRVALDQVSVTHVASAHQALVRSIAFSPDGQLLATCSWDRTSTLLRTSVRSALGSTWDFRY